MRVRIPAKKILIMWAVVLINQEDYSNSLLKLKKAFPKNFFNFDWSVSDLQCWVSVR